MDDTPNRTAGRWWRPLAPLVSPHGLLAEVDGADLVDLRRRVLRDGRDDLPAAYPSDAAQSTLHLAVVAPGGLVLGGVTVLVDPLPGFASLRLALMAVDPAWQGRGIGRSLVTGVQQRAAAADLAVWAAARSTAEGFYVGLGFRPRGDCFVGAMDLPHRRVLWSPR